MSASQLGRLPDYSQSEQQDEMAKNVGADVYLYVVETDAKQSDFVNEEEAFQKIHDSIKIAQ